MSMFTGMECRDVLPPLKCRVAFIPARTPVRDVIGAQPPGLALPPSLRARLPREISGHHDAYVAA
eukprot:707750-Rhodomonas_salina.1